MAKIITKEQIDTFFKNNYYIASEQLKYYTLIAINQLEKGTIRTGQDIYTTCLDGPPGAGKSLYAKLFAKMARELLGTEVELISYQCDDSTSKIELFEDINVGAAVANKPEKVNIPGVLSRAIIEANKGVKVILFIDEYDKTREQVDSLFLQFLQDGVINTNQFGDLKIKEEYKGNIQVIFCKNDFRTELTGPLTRRTRMIYLDIMKPNDFYDLAMHMLYTETEEKQEKAIIDLVSLVYEEIYKDKDSYKRICAPSELFGCIEDLSFLAHLETPNYILFETLINDLFKDKDDAEIFKNHIGNMQNTQLKNILTALSSKKPENTTINLISLITEKIREECKKEAEKLIVEERKQLERALKEAERAKKDSELSKQKNELQVKQYLDQIKQEFASLCQTVSQNSTGITKDYTLNFFDTTGQTRRGKDVFENLTNAITLATLTIPIRNFSIEKLMIVLKECGAIIYENGFLFTNPNSIVLVREENKENIIFSFFVNPSEFLEQPLDNQEKLYHSSRKAIDKISNIINSLNQSVEKVVYSYEEYDYFSLAMRELISEDNNYGLK